MRFDPCASTSMLVRGKNYIRFIPGTIQDADLVVQGL